MALIFLEFKTFNSKRFLFISHIISNPPWSSVSNSKLLILLLHFHFWFKRFLPPANEVCEGYVFTRVCHSVHGAGSTWAGIPPGIRYPPRTRYTPRTRYPPGAVHAGRYGQQAGGTHPTGVHSCFLQCLNIFRISMDCTSIAFWKSSVKNMNITSSEVGHSRV